MCVVHMADPRGDCTVSNTKRYDVEKQRFWRQRIGEAARSGLSIREFCRQRRLKECQFYWWQRKLKNGQQRTWGRRAARRGQRLGDAPRFALVSEDASALSAGIELVLANGRRLRISQGVDEHTLRTVLTTLEADPC